MGRTACTGGYKGSMKEIWRHLDGRPKNKELWSYVVKFEFSRPKSSSHIISEKQILLCFHRFSHSVFKSFVQYRSSVRFTNKIC